MTAERLRFDFNLHWGLRAAELAAVEELVNGWVADDIALTTREMPLAQAKAAGVCALQPLWHVLQAMPLGKSIHSAFGHS